jgi:hypothetical protein
VEKIMNQAFVLAAASPNQTELVRTQASERAQVISMFRSAQSVAFSLLADRALSA